eukprot:gene20872-22923_t
MVNQSHEAREREQLENLARSLSDASRLCTEIVDGRQRRSSASGSTVMNVFSRPSNDDSVARRSPSSVHPKSSATTSTAFARSPSEGAVPLQSQSSNLHPIASALNHARARIQSSTEGVAFED